MGRALANFRELAQAERQEPKMVQMIERFDLERSDLILHNIQDTLRFMRLVGDVANLFFPVMLDTLVTGGNNGLTTSEETIKEDFLKNIEPQEPTDKNKLPRTPDSGLDKNDPPGSDGPVQS